MKRRKVANLLALAVLSLLRPGYPMHPYQIANVLRRTGKERDMSIKVGSLYTVVRNLERHGFIEATGSHRAGRRPERTEYVITDAGRAELRDWLFELVAVPESEYPRFQAALSVLSTLHPDEAAASLQERVRALEDDIAARRDALAHSEGTRRLFLIEAEYALEMRRAEAAWVRCLLEEITNGNFPDLVGWREFHDTGRVRPSSPKCWPKKGEPPQTDRTRRPRCGARTPHRGRKPRTESRGNGNLAYEAPTARVTGFSSHGHDTQSNIGGTTRDPTHRSTARNHSRRTTRHARSGKAHDEKHTYLAR